ncbi:hypothetical protein GN956_G25198 [Arapaima gigas]
MFGFEPRPPRELSIRCTSQQGRERPPPAGTHLAQRNPERRRNIVCRTSGTFESSKYRQLPLSNPHTHSHAGTAET